MDASDPRSPPTAECDYWRESARPLVSLVFVIPMLLVYEGGLLVLGPQAMRNGADLWLRWTLERLGFGQFLVLPLVTCCGLLAWHHVRREPWRFAWPVLSGMLLESIVLGVTLLAVAHAQGALLASLRAPTWLASVPAADGVDHLVAFFGAGIYEELLFRLLLLPVAACGFQAAGVGRRASWVCAVLATSLLFATAHYRLDLTLGAWRLATEVGETFDWTSFAFRFVAGSFFSAVFLGRGFGVAVGAHALYDVLVFLS